MWWIKTQREGGPLTFLYPNNDRVAGIPTSSKPRMGLESTESQRKKAARTALQASETEQAQNQPAIRKKERKKRLHHLIQNGREN